MLNLLRNAVDAMSGVEDRTRLVVIRTGLDQSDQIRVSVEDAGTGLDPEASTRLFEAFYSTKASGMGIGLSVSRTIIEGHGGRLWATPNEGPGATFAFSIPRQLARAPSMYRGDGGAMPTVTTKPEQERPS
jgi:signal transduction histidine kinase